MTQADILKILNESKGFTVTAGGKRYRNSQIIYRMLQQMYQRQTEMEKSSYSTQVDNGVGFNGLDANILSDIAVRSQKYKDLTERQAALVAKKLKKYIRQLCNIAGIEYKAEKKAKKAKQQELFTDGTPAGFNRHGQDDYPYLAASGSFTEERN